MHIALRKLDGILESYLGTGVTCDVTENDLNAMLDEILDLAVHHCGYGFCDNCDR